MIEGVQVELIDGKAYVEFLDKTVGASVLGEMIAAGGTQSIKLNTGGPRRTYIVPEWLATTVGLVPVSFPTSVPKRRGRKPATVQDDA